MLAAEFVFGSNPRPHTVVVFVGQASGVTDSDLGNCFNLSASLFRARLRSSKSGRFLKTRIVFICSGDRTVGGTPPADQHRRSQPRHDGLVASQVFAFPLASGSKDAAFVVTLPPGQYTVHAKASDGVSTGVVLVEVYAVP